MSHNSIKLARGCLVPTGLIFLVAALSWAQGKSSWLDRPVANWNSSGREEARRNTELRQKQIAEGDRLVSALLG